MKTTVEIGDALGQEARQMAADLGTSLRELIEAGLRRELERRRGESVFELKDGSFEGEGLREEFEGARWEAIRKAAYEGRGR